MATDRALSPDFELHEFPGWEQATESQVARLQELVRTILQPLRDRWGEIVPTSWIAWRDGTPRIGPHADAGVVDFTTSEAPLWTAFAWLSQTRPNGVGTAIYERDHIHITLPGVQGRVGWWMIEETEGEYLRVDPPLFEVPGFDVVVPGPRWWLLGALLALAYLSRSRDL